MVKITIDDVQVEVEEGSTILEAAQKAEIYIPTLCYHPKISPSDSCGLCIVKVQGVRRPMTSCNTQVVEGMRVITGDPQIQELRSRIVKLILVDHPLDCPVCDKAGECVLQQIAYELGITEQSFELDYDRKKVIDDWPLIQYDPNRCVTCARCIKVCHEVQGVSALRLVDRGYMAHVGTADGGPLDCEFCGQCVEICPTGALVDKLFKYRARTWELKKVRTVCPYCSAGCAIELNVKDNRLYRITSPDDSINQGNLCIAGRFGYGFVQHSERLKSPMLRTDGRLSAVSWDEALDFTAGTIKEIVSSLGPDGMAGLGSPRVTNEDNYAFQKFFRAVIGTNNIDSEARFTFMRGLKALELTTGSKGATNSIDELLDAGAILLIGTDPSEEVPAIGWKVKAAARKFDSNLIVANSRLISVTPFARATLRYVPYSENDLILGMMKSILDRNLWDRGFVLEKVANFLPLKELLDKMTMEGILRRTGIEREALEEAAEIFASAQSAAIIFGGDLIRQANGLQCIMNLANLALLTGNVGRTNSGLYPIYEKNNIQGLCDVGLMPEYLPGYRLLAEARDDFERIWGAKLPYTRGMTVPEMVRAIEEGKIAGLYVMGADPLIDYPYTGRLEKALKKLKLLVVQDIFLSRTAEHAHVVLPALSFAERGGTYTNIEHRIQRLRPGLKSEGEAKEDWLILEEIASRMGSPLGFTDTASVTREMAVAVPFYKGIESKDNGDIVGRPDQERQGVRMGGRPYAFAPARVPLDRIPPEERDYPFTLVAGKSLFHFGTLSTRAEGIMQVCAQPYVELSYGDAERLGIEDGDKVTVESRAGRVVGKARRSRRLKEGLVFVPIHFASMEVNRLFDENTNVCRVRVIPNRVGEFDRVEAM